MLGGGAGDGKLGVVGVRHGVVEVVLVVTEHKLIVLYICNNGRKSAELIY